MTFWLFLLLSGLLDFSQLSAEDSRQKENSTLLLVQAIFRHGERAPLFNYKNDPNEPGIWPDGLGKLTRFGKKQHYAVGKLLRSMYDGFLTTDPKEVSVKSSSEDRCLRGAAVTAAGLYEPEGIWKFEDDLNWQPIPVYYLPGDQDKYLNGYSFCPEGFNELTRLFNSEEMQKLAKKHQIMLEEVSNYVEMNISQEFNALYLQDTLSIEKSNHLPIPTLLDKYFEDIQEFAEGIFKCTYGSDLIQRLRFGPLLGEISENMKRKINGDIPDLKFQLYCGHDVQVAAFLEVFGFRNVLRPPTCATLLFELHEMADTTMAVRLLYMNSTGPSTEMEEPHILVLDGCSEYCPLANFTMRFQHLIPADWEQECQLDAASKYNKSVEILYLVFAIIAVICFISLICIYYYSKRRLEREEKCVPRITVRIPKMVA